VHEAIELYRLFSSLDYLPSSPTLFNAGTLHEQLSSCFLLDSPGDSLESVYDKYKDIALLSKFSGGIGVAWHRVRCEGSLIRSTNGLSNGIVPWLKTLDSSVAAVNQGGKRKGAACVYLEPWHADIEAFLELRDNTGDEARRTHHLNLANWVPDLFMQRVEADESWSLFDPKDVPELPDLWGDRLRGRLRAGRGAGLARKRMPARELIRPHDAHPGADRQRLDDLQGQVQSRLQPDRAAAGCGAFVESLHRDPRGHQRRRDRRLQLGQHQPGASRRGRQVRFRQARAYRGTRGAPVGPGHRHELLPAAGGAHLESALASGRPGPDGPAGRVLQIAPAVRQRRGARAVAPHLGGDLFPRLRTSCEMARDHGAHAAFPEPGPRRANCSSMPGMSFPRTRALAQLREEIKRTACATAC
jgi:hypothetical protein